MNKVNKPFLQDFAKAIHTDPTRADKSFYGVVKGTIEDESGKIRGYRVSLGGNDDIIECRKFAGADVGDTVMVTLMANGTAVVTGRRDGDGDAIEAKATADDAAIKAEQAAEDVTEAGKTATNYITDISSGSGIEIKSSLDTKNKTQIKSDGMHLFANVNGTSKEIATFGASAVYLGKNNSRAIISLCGDNGAMYFNSAQQRFQVGSSNYGVSLYADDGLGQYDFDRAGWNYANGATYDTTFGYTLNGGFVLEDTPLKDWVIEQGTSSSWYYRKWKSGKVELWRTYTASFAIATSAAGGYSTEDSRTLSLPFSITTPLYVSATGGANFWSASVSGSTLSYRPYRMKSSSSTSRTINFYIMGTL